MFQVGEKVWGIINIFAPPKEVIVKDTLLNAHTQNFKITEYIVQYKNREFHVSNENLYYDQKEAEIYWAILVKQDYESTLLYPELFNTDDFERANIIASVILEKYVETDPDILLKHL